MSAAIWLDYLSVYIAFVRYLSSANREPVTGSWLGFWIFLNVEKDGNKTSNISSLEKSCTVPSSDAC